VAPANPAHLEVLGAAASLCVVAVASWLFNGTLTVKVMIKAIV
jgi:hypothetical protein